MTRLQDKSPRKTLMVLAVPLFLSVTGCSTVVVEENKFEPVANDSGEFSVVVLGRRQSSNYDTEEGLVKCVANKLEGKSSQVISEEMLSDAIYPWLEPRIAPLKVNGVLRMMNRPKIREKLDEIGLRYIVWVDGSTQTTSQSGSLSCAIGPGVVGCYGMGIWTNESDYEVSIWDIEAGKEVNTLSVTAEGTSYLPAIIVPIPLIARVQTSACKGISDQVEKYFTGTS
jgi:hypothetical protein